MRKKITTARFRADGALVRINQEGGEEPIPTAPIPSKTEAEIEASAAADAEIPSITPERRKRLLRVPRVKTLRRAIGLTQEEFANRYAIPIGTLRDWEQGRTEPDQAAQAYLNLIARDPAAAARPAAAVDPNLTTQRSPGFQVGQLVYPKAAPSLHGAIMEIRQSSKGGFRYKVFHSASLVREYDEEQLAAT
jgi:putative transcriptional regulator